MISYWKEKAKLWGFLKSFEIDLANGFIPPPKYVGWDCSRVCNLNCEHCGAKKEKYFKELTTAQIKKLIDRISQIEVEYFEVTGGEPLLRKDIFEIFQYAKGGGLKTGISTNGFFVDESNAPKIAKIFDLIQISLDGPETIHNKIRGNPQAFEKAIGAVKLLHENHASQISISTVVTPRNFLYLNNLAEIINQLNANLWKIITIMPIGRAKNKTNLLLSQKQFHGLMNFTQKNVQKYKILLAENMGHLGKYETKVRSLPFLCPVGLLALCIGVDGNVRGCPEQPDTAEFREGNILKKDILSIWQNGFKKYRKQDLTKRKKCQKCHYKKGCRGGCWVMETQGLGCSVERYCLTT